MSPTRKIQLLALTVITMGASALFRPAELSAETKAFECPVVCDDVFTFWTENGYVVTCFLETWYCSDEISICDYQCYVT